MAKLPDMGFDKVIKQIVEDRKGGEPEVLDDLGFGNIIDQQVQRQQQREMHLRDAKRINIVVPPETMNEVLEIRKNISRLVAGKDCETAVKDVENYLRTLNWKHIFNTGEKVWEPEMDSLYFVNEYGFSLRLKKANLKTGNPNKVIQVMMELIFFVRDNGEISFEPKQGYTVKEFLSQDFLDFQDGKKLATSEYTSPIVIANKDGNFFVVNTATGHQHKGHEVNNIEKLDLSMKKVLRT